MSENSVWNDNYFFRDYVTDDILSYGVGPVWLYHFKETLIGVRDTEAKISYFCTIESIAAVKGQFVPTIEQLTEAHITEAIEEVDRSGEEIKRIPITEIMSTAKELTLREFGREMDARLTGQARQAS